MEDDELKLWATLLPDDPFFARFANDKRLAGIRLNSATLDLAELDTDLGILRSTPTTVPIFFDIKGRQVRVTEIHKNPIYLDVSINHRISVNTPVKVWFKGGTDPALLSRVEEGGKRLIFSGMPIYEVPVGASFHILDPSYKVFGPMFTELEKEKLVKVRGAFSGYYLSYVYSSEYVEEFLDLVGHDQIVYLKIENQEGIDYVSTEFVKKPNLVLVVARGDLFVELGHSGILAAHRQILAKDPEAMVGSRMLLSLIKQETPACADLSELAWLCDLGFRKFLLCDDLCRKESWLANAIDVFEDFRWTYVLWSALHRAVTTPAPALPRRSVLRRLLRMR